MSYTIYYGPKHSDHDVCRQRIAALDARAEQAERERDEERARLDGLVDVAQKLLDGSVSCEEDLRFAFVLERDRDNLRIAIDAARKAND